MKPIPIPKGFTARVKDRRFTWTRNWVRATKFAWIAYLGVPSSLALLYMAYKIFLEYPYRDYGPALALAMFLFPAMYFILRYLCNRTIITLDERELWVRDIPIPPIGSKRIERQKIAIVYSHERQTKDSYDNIHLSYEVWARGHDKTKHCLLKDLPTSAQALYLEKELKMALILLSKP